MKKFQNGDNEAGIKYSRIACCCNIATIVGFAFLIALIIIELNFF